VDYLESASLTFPLHIDAVGLELKVPVINRLIACDVQAMLTLVQSLSDEGE
jgi:hypothetical protein